MDSDAVNISRFKCYHHYLDSLIAEEDIRYLQDGELARLIGLSSLITVAIIDQFLLIAELGYRGAGRTLTEKEYLEEVERIEMAKRLKEINENAEQVRVRLCRINSRITLFLPFSPRPVTCSGLTPRIRKWSVPSNKGRL